MVRNIILIEYSISTTLQYLQNGKNVGFDLIDWSDSAHYLLNYEPHFSLYLTNRGAYKTRRGAGKTGFDIIIRFFWAICDAGFCHIFYH